MTRPPASPASVVVFTTGGTIAATHDPDRGGLTTSLSMAQVAAALPPDESGRHELVALANLPSVAITPSLVLCWRAQLSRALERTDVAGVVLTTGTNAMEEVAFLLDILTDHAKPIVVTGAMRATTDPSPDGPINLRDAILVARDPQSRDLGVLVIMNSQIHAARHVRKISGQGLDAFASPQCGPLGHLSRLSSGTVVRILATPHRRPHVATETLEDRVALLSTGIGMDSQAINAAIDAGCRGLVIEGFAGGDLTPGMADGIRRARHMGIPVVVASSGWAGEPTDRYAGPGEGTWLREHGVHLAADIPARKARLALMAALGAQAPEAILSLIT